MDNNLNQIVLQPDVAEFVRAVADKLKMKEGKTAISVAEKIKLAKGLGEDSEQGAKARKDFAHSRAELVLPLLPLQSTVRNIFTPEDIPAGATPSYPISFEATPMAWVAPSLGGVATQIVNLNEIFVPQLEFDGYVEFPAKFARDGRYSIVEEASNALKNSMLAKEEIVGWRTIRSVFSGLRADQTILTGGLTATGNLFSELTLSGVNSLYTRMDQMRRNLNVLCLTPLRYGNIRNWTTVAIDYDTQREIIQNAGPVGGRLYGTELRKVYDTTNILPDGEIYGFDTSKFGKMPITAPLETRDDPMAFTRRMVGTHAFQTAGFAVMDPWGMVRMQLTPS